MKLRTVMLSILLIVLSISMTSGAFGQEVHGRIVHQHKRIHQGVKSGRLDHRQAARLRAADARIHGRAVRDRIHDKGRLTPSQRRRLNHSLNRNSKKIWKEKHSGMQ